MKNLRLIPLALLALGCGGSDSDPTGLEPFTLGVPGIDGEDATVQAVSIISLPMLGSTINFKASRTVSSGETVVEAGGSYSPEMTWPAQYSF